MANLSDDFDRADGEIGSNWTEDSGDIDIVSNAAVGQASTSAINRARYTNSALDGNDHDCQADIIHSSAEDAKITLRQASSTETCYFGQFRGPWGGSNSWAIGKIVSGSETDLDTGTDQAWSEPSTIWTEIDGTTLSGQINSGDDLSATDSAIASGTYAGIHPGYEGTSSYNNWQANDLAAGVTVAPPAGSLGLSGFAPTVSVSNHQTVAPPVASINPTGLAPVVAASGNQTVAPPVASINLSGLAPAIQTTNHQTVDVPLASLLLTGFVPTANVSDPQTVAPPAGTLTLAGFAPAVGNPVSISVPVGVLALNGFAPVVDSTEHVNITVPVASLNITGLEPTVVATSPQVVDVPVGSITLQGYAPNIIYITIVTPDGRTIVIEAETRTLAIAQDDRVLAIESENRTYVIQ